MISSLFKRDRTFYTSTRSSTRSSSSRTLFNLSNAFRYLGWSSPMLIKYESGGVRFCSRCVIAWLGESHPVTTWCRISWNLTSQKGIKFLQTLLLADGKELSIFISTFSTSTESRSSRENRALQSFPPPSPADTGSCHHICNSSTHVWAVKEVKVRDRWKRSPCCYL